MADPEHVEVVKRGAAAVAEWRQENPGVILDLGKANFRYANLRGADLVMAVGRAMTTDTDPSGPPSAPSSPPHRPCAGGWSLSSVHPAFNNIYAAALRVIILPRAPGSCASGNVRQFVKVHTSPFAVWRKPAPTPTGELKE